MGSENAVLGGNVAKPLIISLLAPADLPDCIAPKLVEHYERVKNEPRIKAYYAQHNVVG
jgi:hypothetical protein